MSEIKDNESLEYRVTTFYLILDLLNGNNTSLYNLQQKTPGSLYTGDYGLLKIYIDVNCLLGLVVNEQLETIIECSPQSWMASNRINHLIAGKRPIYLEGIITIPKEIFDETNSTICKQ